MTNIDSDSTRKPRREGGGRRGASADGRTPVPQLPRRKLKRLFPAMEIVSADAVTRACRMIKSRRSEWTSRCPKRATC